MCNIPPCELTNSSDMYTAIQRRRLPKSIFHGRVSCLDTALVADPSSALMMSSSGTWMSLTSTLSDGITLWKTGSALTEATTLSCQAYISFCTERRHVRRCLDRRVHCERPWWWWGHKTAFIIIIQYVTLQDTAWTWISLLFLVFLLYERKWKVRL